MTVTLPLLPAILIAVLLLALGAGAAFGALAWRMRRMRLRWAREDAARARANAEIAAGAREVPFDGETRVSKVWRDDELVFDERKPK